MKALRSPTWVGACLLAPEGRGLEDRVRVSDSRVLTRTLVQVKDLERFFFIGYVI